jgi:hypothetical protein
MSPWLPASGVRPLARALQVQVRNNTHRLALQQHCTQHPVRCACRAGPVRRRSAIQWLLPLPDELGLGEQAAEEGPGVR